MTKLLSVWISYGFLCILLIIPLGKSIKWSFTSVNKKSIFSAKPFLPPPKPVEPEPPRVETTTQAAEVTVKTQTVRQTTQKFRGSGIVLSNPGYVRENPEPFYTGTRQQQSPVPSKQQFDRPFSSQAANQYDQSAIIRPRERLVSERTLADLSTVQGRQRFGGENSRQKNQGTISSGNMRQINQEFNSAVKDYQSRNQPQGRQNQPYSNLRIMSDLQLSSQNTQNNNQVDGSQRNDPGLSRSKSRNQIQNYPMGTQGRSRMSSPNRQFSEYQESRPQMRQFQEPYPYKKELNALNNDIPAVIQINPQNANTLKSDGQSKGLSISFQNLRAPSYEFQPPPSQVIQRSARPQTTEPTILQPVPNIPSLNQLQPIKRHVKNSGFNQGQGRRQRRIRNNNYQTTPPPRYNNYATTLPPMGPRRQMNPSSPRGPQKINRPEQGNYNNRYPQGPLGKHDRPGRPCRHTAECERGCCYTLEGEILDIDTYGPNGPKFGRGEGRCTSREPGLRERCDDLCSCQQGLECYRRYQPNYSQGEKMARNPRYEPPEITTRPPRKCVRRAVALAERFAFWKCYFDSMCSGPLPT